MEPFFMLYMLLCYNDEEVTSAWSDEEDAAVMKRLQVVHEKWADQYELAARLMPTNTAATLHKKENLVTDGPYAETKEQLLGFYLVEVEDQQQALDFARDLTEANPGGAYELRPVKSFHPSTTTDTDNATA
jgi:hypothetical protein